MPSSFTCPRGDLVISVWFFFLNFCVLHWVGYSRELLGVSAVRVMCSHGRVGTRANMANHVPMALHVSCVTCLNSADHLTCMYKSTSRVNKAC